MTLRARAQSIVVEALVEYGRAEAPAVVAIHLPARLAVERNEVRIRRTDGGVLAPAEALKELQQLGVGSELDDRPQKIGALQSVFVAPHAFARLGSGEQRDLGGGAAAARAGEGKVAGGGRVHRSIGFESEDWRGD